MELHCPDCGSIVYSRRSPKCGVCGKPLPESFRFSPEEAARYEEQLRIAKEGLDQAVAENREIEEQTRERLREVQRRSNSIFPPPFM
ncbi:MAG: hypothetical protein JWO82_3618 [Akkermansiaceae bacterium]|nr:hypothetical protein [Akkermansiaceae bacterium]